MPTPFPGVDPYLERTGLWPDVHNRLIVRIADELAPRLRPRYFVSIEERTYTVVPGDVTFAGRADLAVAQRANAEPARWEANTAHEAVLVTVELPLPDTMRETYLEIRSVEGEQIITVLEVLSLSNKRPGEGRDQYLRKRLSVLGTLTHLVEIDLLRGGQPMPMYGYQETSDYRILLSRAERRPQADLLAFGIRQPIPTFRLPLQTGDGEPEVDLNQILHQLYDRAGYDLRIDYREAPEPPLAGHDQAWAEALLRDSGLR